MKTNTINHEWSVLSSNAILDQDTNNLSLINVIEQISLDVNLKEGEQWNESEGGSFPLNMVIVSRLRKLVNDDDLEVSELVKGDLKIDLVSPDKENLSSFEKDFELVRGADNIRMRFGIGGLKFTKSGLYYFEVSLRGEPTEKYKKVYSLPLRVNLNIKKYDKDKKAIMG